MRYAPFDDPCIDEITADDLLGEYPAVQYNPPEGTFHIDLLTRLGELYDFASLESERKLFGDLPVTVVTPRMLYQMKKGRFVPTTGATPRESRRNSSSRTRDANQEVPRYFRDD